MLYRKDRFLQYIEDNKYLLVMFLVSTAFFLYQHYYAISWDFTVYVSNAKHLVGQGSFYEILRPPFMSVLLVGLSVFGWKAAEYLFIVLVSAGFLYSSVRLAKLLKVNERLFYFVSLSPYVLLYSFLAGTELLSLVLLELFLIFILEKRSYAGLFLGLAFLTRYNMIVFAPLILFIKDVKKILEGVVLGVLAVVPWLAYNIYSTGNMFTALADSYALNVIYRGYAIDPVNYSHLFTVLLYLLPFFLLGLISVSYNWKNKKEYWLMVFLILLGVYQYYTMPTKLVRYVFPFVVPISYFSAVGLSKLRRERLIFNLIIAVLIVLSFNYVVDFTAENHIDDKEQYLEAIRVTQELGIDDCRLSSNAWPVLNYFGRQTERYPRVKLIDSRLEAGDFVLFFNSGEKPDYSYTSGYPIVYETDKFILLGDLDKCNRIREVDITYMSYLQEYIEYRHGYPITTDPCYILFNENQMVEKVCNFVNLRGFRLTEYRVGV